MRMQQIASNSKETRRKAGGKRSVEISSLTEFRIHDTPDPLADELKAVETLRCEYHGSD